MEVSLVNRNTGELKAIKVGWSWTIFFWNHLFSLPLFLRGLYGYAAIRLVLFILAAEFGINFIALESFEQMPTFERADGLPVLISLLPLVFDIYMGVKGNELTAKKYNRKNWDFAEPDSPAARYAKQKWGISDATPPPLESAGQGAQ